MEKDFGLKPMRSSQPEHAAAPIAVDSAAPESVPERERHLLASAQTGDRAAFRELVARHYGSIHRIAYRFTGHREDAEDIAQEVCVKLARALPSFRGEASLKTWLYTVVVNACRDMQRQRRRHDSEVESYCELEAHRNALSVEKARKIAWLYREIAKLESKLKETALLVLAEDLSHAEAAKVLGCTESTISWRMYKIRKGLKARLEAGHD